MTTEEQIEWCHKQAKHDIDNLKKYKDLIKTKINELKKVEAKIRKSISKAQK